MTTDLFAVLRACQSVARVSNLYDERLARLHNWDEIRLPLNLMLFLCPKMSGKGLRVNRSGTGLRVSYMQGPSKSTEARIEKADKFLEEVVKQDIKVTVQGVFAAADALILFPIPQCPPDSCDAEEQMLIRLGLSRSVRIAFFSNLELVECNRDLFAQFYEEEPWRAVPRSIQVQEEERLRAMLPQNIPDYVGADFVRRTFAGFALDGVLLRQGAFGHNPVILGVESPGVAILQNAALRRVDWLPVIQLR